MGFFVDQRLSRFCSVGQLERLRHPATVARQTVPPYNKGELLGKEREPRSGVRLFSSVREATNLKHLPCVLLLHGVPILDPIFDNFDGTIEAGALRRSRFWCWRRDNQLLFLDEFGVFHIFIAPPLTIAGLGGQPMIAVVRDIARVQCSAAKRPRRQPGAAIHFD